MFLDLMRRRRKEFGLHFLETDAYTAKHIERAAEIKQTIKTSYVALGMVQDALLHLAPELRNRHFCFVDAGAVGGQSKFSF